METSILREQPLDNSLAAKERFEKSITTTKGE